MAAARFLPLLVPLLVGPLFGCGEVREPSPPLHEAVAAGDRLVVLRALSAESGGRTIYLRGGGTRSWLGFGAWDTMCRIRLAEDAIGGRLEPGEQRVREITHGYDTVSSEMLDVYTEILLSPPGPVEWMRCGRSVDLSAAALPVPSITLEEFQRAVGDYLGFER